MQNNIKHKIHLLTNEIANWRALIIIAITTLIYIAFPIYAINYRFALYLLSSNIQFIGKIVDVVGMLEALTTLFTTTDLALLIVAGILVGINIVLLIKTTQLIRTSNA